MVTALAAIGLAGATTGQAIRVMLVDGPDASVETDADAATRFSTGPSRIEASGLGAGTVTVLLPRSLVHATVVADGQRLLVKDGSTLQPHAEVEEQTAGTVVFRVP